jgi:hypothetical protein
MGRLVFPQVADFGQQSRYIVSRMSDEAGIRERPSLPTLISAQGDVFMGAPDIDRSVGQQSAGREPRSGRRGVQSFLDGDQLFIGQAFIHGQRVAR